MEARAAPGGGGLGEGVWVEEVRENPSQAELQRPGDEFDLIFYVEFLKIQKSASKITRRVKHVGSTIMFGGGGGGFQHLGQGDWSGKADPEHPGPLTGPEVSPPSHLKMVSSDLESNNVSL